MGVAGRSSGAAGQSVEGRRIPKRLRGSFAKVQRLDRRAARAGSCHHLGVNLMTIPRFFTPGTEQKTPAFAGYEGVEAFASDNPLRRRRFLVFPAIGPTFCPTRRIGTWRTLRVGLVPNSGAAIVRETPTVRVLFPEHASASGRIVDDHPNRSYSIVCAGEHIAGVDQRWPISP